MFWEMINVIHIAQCAGGVDRYLKMLLRHMDRTAFRQILICSYDFQEKEYMGLVDSFEYVDMKNALSLSSDIKAVIKIRKIIKRIQPEIVYCHSSKAGGVGRIAAIGLRTAVVYNPHGWAFSMRGIGPGRCFFQFIEKILEPLTDKYVLISKYEYREAIRKITSKGKCVLIENGIDYDELAENIAHSNLSRKNIGIPDGGYVIGTVGRLSPQKAPDVFIRMASVILKNISNAYFVMVGGGEAKDEVQRLAKECGIEKRLIIVDWTANVAEYVLLFDVAVLLSRWEGFGLVLPEYMYLGKPIVATKAGAIPDIIHDGENGLLVDVDCPEQAADAIIKLHNNPKKTEAIITYGKKEIRKYDIQRVANQHECMFKSAYKQ